MNLFIHLLLWLHFAGLGMAVGGGVALGRVGPSLVAAPAEQRGQWWPLETFFGRVGAAGMVALLVTGPLMLWLKFAGPDGLNHWFWAKMGFVGLAVVGVGLHEWAGVRFARGDERAVRWMFFGGRLAGAAILLAILCAVFTFT